MTQAIIPIPLNADLESARAFNHSKTKRFMDYLLGIPSLIVMLPFFLLIGILIKIDSPGPVFYKQKRAGMNGRIFEVIKFRTMKYKADDSVHRQRIKEYAEGKINAADGVKLTNDTRITRVGRFLRNTSVDELPQIFNVIKGDMSLVGPRPVPIYEAEKYKLWQSERLSTLPGITGLWQISGRSTVSFDEQLRLDIRYIRHQSLWLNIVIILNTVPAIISRRGAG